jgi:hypothetical protein
MTNKPQQEGEYSESSLLRRAIDVTSAPIWETGLDSVLLKFEKMGSIMIISVPTMNYRAVSTMIYHIQTTVCVYYTLCDNNLFGRYVDHGTFFEKRGVSCQFMQALEGGLSWITVSWSRHSAVSIPTGYGFQDRGFGVRDPVGSRT